MMMMRMKMRTALLLCLLRMPCLLLAEESAVEPWWLCLRWLRWLRWLRREPALEMLSEGATVSVSLKSSTSRSSMKSSESEPESESSCLLVACDLASRPRRLSTKEAALDATLEGAFEAEEGGGEGARLWLLDEPTSMLDPDGAARLRSTIADVLAETGATCVVVEHRVEAWAELVDRVAVLEPGGGVVEQGSPSGVFAAAGERLAAHGVWVPGRHPRVSTRAGSTGRPDRPTAVFTGNDLQALGVYQAAREVGLRIPADLSVVGFDDLPVAALVDPPLTTVHQPLAEMAAAATELALALGRGERTSQIGLELATRLTVRQSTASPAV